MRRQTVLPLPDSALRDSARPDSALPAGPRAGSLPTAAPAGGSPIADSPVPASHVPSSPVPSGHPDIPASRIGVLLINLGTPDGTDFFSMRRYLREFLTDRRVIQWPRALWYPILFGIVLNTRPRRSGRAYAKIWDRKENASPLRVFTQRQAEGLAAQLLEGCANDAAQSSAHAKTALDAATHPAVQVDWAMRYGIPSIDERLRALKEAGCDRILLFPLYPQYCAATTASVNDAAFRSLMKMTWQPSIRIVPPYFDDTAYINALAAHTRASLDQLDFEPERIVMSFHGIPKSYFAKGDPYHCHCQKTARLLTQRLGLEKQRVLVTFQSRFGPEQWLQPYTSETLERLPRENVKKIAVMAPGFAADCVETLEEIALEGREEFIENGGEAFAFLPCLNAEAQSLELIATLVRRELSGWLDSQED